MKFKSYLTEKNNEEILESISQLIKRDCKKYIDEVVKSNITLYRGIFYSNSPVRGKIIENGVYRRKPRKDREPADTPIEIHRYLDEQFKKKFGWNVRSEGVFTVKNKRITYNYGTAYMFFPIGDYKYVYSTKIEDLYTYIEDGQAFYMYILKDDDVIKREWLSVFEKRHYEKLYGEFTNKGEYIFRDEPTGEYEYYKAMLVVKRKYPDITKAEIDEELVWEPEVSYDEYLDKTIKTYRQIFYNDIERVMKSYKTSNIQSVGKDTEIIFKCKEYYAVHEKYDVKLLNELLIRN